MNAAPDWQAIATEALSARSDHKFVGRVHHSTDTMCNKTVWVEFAAATHNGSCSDCENQRTSPAWDHVDNGRITGIWGTADCQCCGCGQMGFGWVTTGAEQVDPDRPTEQMNEMLDRLTSLMSALFEDEVERITRNLKKELQNALETVSELTSDFMDDNNTLTLFAAQEKARAEVSNGYTEPGVFEDDGFLFAWAWEPFGFNRIITVTEADL